VAGALGASAEAGIFDAGLAAAGGEAASALLVEETQAAVEAGLSQEEATRAGFAAIAPILQQQLNASIRSGQELDENTKRLLEEAKANGIEILADPALQQLDVAKQQLGVLQQIAGQGGKTNTVFVPGDGSEGERRADVSAALGFGPMITPDMGGGLGPVIQTHARELAMVIPASRLGRDGLISAAGGLATVRQIPGRSRGGDQISFHSHIDEDRFQTAEGKARLRDHTMRTIKQDMSRHLVAQIQNRRA